MKIKSSTQLKAFVRNKSGGDSAKAQLIIRNYIMGRFLVRVSESKYRNNIVLKGGTLIASIIGIDKRSTMDMDTTLLKMEMNADEILIMLEEIIKIESEDNIIFEVTGIETIMEDLNYSGVRAKLEAKIDKMRTPLIIDFSMGDILTPRAIEYSYPLIFEQGEITILAYNIETLLAEKFETIISRGVLNSRMRDFYDVYSILSIDSSFKGEKFNLALQNTGKQRGSYILFNDWADIVSEIEVDDNMKKLWRSYQNKFDYAENIEWLDVMQSVKELGSYFEV